LTEQSGDNSVEMEENPIIVTRSQARKIKNKQATKGLRLKTVREAHEQYEVSEDEESSSSLEDIFDKPMGWQEQMKDPEFGKKKVIEEEPAPEVAYIPPPVQIGGWKDLLNDPNFGKLVQK